VRQGQQTEARVQAEVEAAVRKSTEQHQAAEAASE
jgi:hypothetical protein